MAKTEGAEPDEHDMRAVTELGHAAGEAMTKAEALLAKYEV